MADKCDRDLMLNVPQPSRARVIGLVRSVRRATPPKVEVEQHYCDRCQRLARALVEHRDADDAEAIAAEKLQASQYVHSSGENTASVAVRKPPEDVRKAYDAAYERDCQAHAAWHQELDDLLAKYPVEGQDE